MATPGRLMDHYNRKTIRLDKIQTVVLDEADRMLDMGFFKDVTRIIDKVKNRRNLGLFSATISQEVTSALCSTSLPWIASCKILFFNSCGVISPPPQSTIRRSCRSRVASNRLSV